MLNLLKLVTYCDYVKKYPCSSEIYTEVFKDKGP